VRRLRILGLVVIGCSAQASVERLGNELSKHDLKLITLKPENAKKFGGASRTYQTIDYESKLTFYLTRGKLSLGKGSFVSTGNAGASTLCITEKPSEQEMEKAFGTPSQTQVERFVNGLDLRDDAWVDSVFAKKQTRLLLTLASSGALNDAQIARLLAESNDEISSTLITNKKVNLTNSQLDAIIAGNSGIAQQALVSSRFTQLNESQKASLRSLPVTQKQAALRSGGTIALDMLRGMLKRGEDGELLSIAWSEDLTPEMVDAILELRKTATRSHFSMSSKFMYSPAQIEQMLLDANAEVVIGVLRRNELKITREQFDRGISSAPPNIAF
jgi:hypothetical protein